MSKVTMVVGPPASGKSTVTKELRKNGAMPLNRDTVGGTIAGLIPLMESLIKDGKDVILDNTFPTIEVRKPFIDTAKRLGADIDCVLMSSTIEDSQFNFVQRAIDLIGEFPTPEAIKKAKHTNIFPPTVLFKYKKEFQKPTIEEGFGKIDVHKFVRKINPEFTNKALIVDYDGTLRECIGGNEKFPVSKDQIEIKPNRTKVLQAYKDKGYRLLGCSNQSGIHKGEVSDEAVKELFEYTNQQLGIDIEYRYCPHQSAPISCYCRKPMPGVFVEFMLKYKLNPKECIFVGDMTTDETFAKRAGIQYVDQAEFFK